MKSKEEQREANRERVARWRADKANGYSRRERSREYQREYRARMSGKSVTISITTPLQTERVAREEDPDFEEVELEYGPVEGVDVAYEGSVEQKHQERALRLEGKEKEGAVHISDSGQEDIDEVVAWAAKRKRTVEVDTSAW